MISENKQQVKGTNDTFDSYVEKTIFYIFPEH